MLCKNCRKKSQCKKPCSKLDRHLDLLTNYQREQLVQPELISKIFSSVPGPEAGEELEAFWEELNLPHRIARMEPRMRQIIVGYFWEGKSLPALARKHKISRSCAQRLFESGLKHLRRSVMRERKAKSNPLLTGLDFSYNKKSGHEEKQG
jgi:hypothetical protein